MGKVSACSSIKDKHKSQIWQIAGDLVASSCMAGSFEGICTSTLASYQGSCTSNYKIYVRMYIYIYICRRCNNLGIIAIELVDLISLMCNLYISILSTGKLVCNVVEEC